MKKSLLISAIVILLDSTKAQPGLTTCADKDSLCDFDYKTGLRKQCIKRYVNGVSNPRDADYKNALKLDADLVAGKETWRCHLRENVDTLMATNQKKDKLTTVTNTYSKYDIPPETGYSDPVADVADLEGFSKQQLQYHNKFRARHGVDGLHLDAVFTSGAQEWAESLVKDDSVLQSAGGKSNTYGESVAKVVLTEEQKQTYATTFYPSQSQTWYDLIEDYLKALYDDDCDIKNKKQDDEEDDKCLSWVRKANPFRQIVWKTTTKVGFGYAKSSDGSAIYIVAWYDTGPKPEEDRETTILETEDYSTVQQDLQYWYVNKASTAPFRAPENDDEFNQNQLAYHNRYRARHGAQPLVLNQDLVKIAEDYQKGVNKDVPTEYGVNTGTDDRASGSKGYYTESTNNWYQNIKYYNFSTPGLLENEQDEKAYSTFTQMMWDSSTSVGFSHYIAAETQNQPFQIVAIYDPPGNTLVDDKKDPIAYKTNVFAIPNVEEEKDESVETPQSENEENQDEQNENVEDNSDDSQESEKEDIPAENNEEQIKNEGSGTVQTIILAIIIVIIIVIIFVAVMKVGGATAKQPEGEALPDQSDFTDLKNINVEEIEVGFPGSDRKNDQEKNVVEENIEFGEAAQQVAQPKAQQSEQVAEIVVNQENQQVVEQPAEQQQPAEDFAVDLLVENNE